MKTIKYLLIIWPAFWYINTNAQTMPEGGVEISQAIPPSPDAAALGKYGNVPVSPYTGVPNISVPLYQIKSGDLTLPVSLSYHAGGNKVEEAASSVGLGWVLNAGGAITRTVRGVPDEKIGGLLDVGQYVPNIDARINHNTGPLSADDAGVLLTEIAMGIIDGEPDVFYYNFGGYSGKFIMDSQGNIMVIPQANIKFSFTIISNSINSFTAITPDGVTYSFGYSATEFTLPHDNYATSWFLNSITSPTGHQISFGYAAANYGLPSHPHSETAYQAIGTNGIISGDVPKPNNTVATSHTDAFTGVRLSNITFENGSIAVNYGIARLDLTGDAEAVSSIAITNQGFSKVYRFSYSNNTSTTRLRLDSLIGLLDPIPGTSNYRKEKYAFTYSADPWSSTNLYAQDWWGYYNGQGNDPYGSGTLIPSYNDGTLSLVGANRTSDETSMLGGMLTRIDYPTGGYTTFTYQANQESNLNLGGTSSIQSPRIGEVDAVSNDPSSPYYNFNDGTDGIFTVFSITNSTTVSVTTSGFEDPTDGSNGSFISFRIEQLDASGNVINNDIFAPPNNGTNSVTLPNGYYTFHVIDMKGQSYNPATNTGIVYTGVVNYTNDNPNSPLINNYIVGGLRIKQIEDFDGVSTTPVNVKTYNYTNVGQTSSSGFLDFQPVYSYMIGYENLNQNVLAGTNYLVRTAISNYPLATTQGSVVGYSHVEEILGGSGENGKNDYFYTNSSSDGDLAQGDPTNGGFPFPPPQVYDWHRGLLTSEINYKKESDGTYVKVQETDKTYATNSQASNIGIKVGFQQVPASPSSSSNYYTSTNFSYGLTVQNTYNNVSDFTYLASDVTTVYGINDPTQSQTTTRNYQYDATTFQLTQVQTDNSKGELVTQKVTYPYNYSATSSSTGALAGIYNLNQLGISNYPVENITQKSNTDGSNLRTIKGVMTTYKPTLPVRDVVYETRSVTPLTIFTNSSVSSNTLAMDASYQPVLSFDNYDVFNNVIQEEKIGDAPHSYIWGYNDNSYPIAEVINANSGDIAYTNFESYSTFTATNGNWVYSNAGAVTDATAPMGAGCYSLSGQTISKSGLNSSLAYLVSFWAKSGASVSVTGGTVTTNPTGTTLNGWTYHEYQATGTTSVTVSGSGLVDELRLYPSNALMSTYTYVPLIGMASNADAKSKITYYEYDNVGRLLDTKDQNGNITKAFTYHLQGQ